MNATNVMRLKTPNAISEPKIAEAIIEERCWREVRRNRLELLLRREQNLVLQDTLDHDDAPCYYERLDRIGEGVCLVGPGNVGGGDQDGGQLSLAREMQQLMNCPILEHEAQAEHEHA